MRREKFEFFGSQGDLLTGRLDLPDTEPLAYALFAHCFTCTKNIRALNYINRAMTAEGFAVLRFDFTGLGESEGDFAETNFSSNIEDLLFAANFLAVNFTAPTVLVGHSLGGAAVLQAAHFLPQVKAVATVGAPYDPEHVVHLFSGHVGEIEARGEAEVMIGGRPFTITRQFLHDLDQADPQYCIRRLDRALLVCHSPIDNVVGVENAALIFKDAKHPKSFLSLDTADHLLSDAADARYVGRMVASWASRYL